MLRSALESHPNIVCQTEVFNSDNPKLPYPLNTPTETILNEWVFKNFDVEVKRVGFVLQSYHPWGLAAFPGIRENPQWRNIWPLLGQMTGLRVIHLKRRNLLARHVSHLQARASGRWHNWHGQRVNNVTHLEGVPASGTTQAPSEIKRPISLDAERLRIDFEDIEQSRARAESDLAMHPVLEVYYEDLCQHFDRECARVLEFLDCRAGALAPATFKLEQTSLSERIANYAELKRFFAGSRWQSFFDA